MTLEVLEDAKRAVYEVASRKTGKDDKSAEYETMRAGLEAGVALVGRSITWDTLKALAPIIVELDHARAEIDGLISGQRRWRMSIPVNSAVDSDMVIHNALDAVVKFTETHPPSVGFAGAVCKCPKGCGCGHRRPSASRMPRHEAPV